MPLPITLWLYSFSLGCSSIDFCAFSLSFSLSVKFPSVQHVCLFVCLFYLNQDLVVISCSHVDLHSWHTIFLLLPLFTLTSVKSVVTFLNSNGLVTYEYEVGKKKRSKYHQQCMTAFLIILTFRNIIRFPTSKPCRIYTNDWMLLSLSLLLLWVLISLRDTGNSRLGMGNERERERTRGNNGAHVGADDNGTRNSEIHPILFYFFIYLWATKCCGSRDRVHVEACLKVDRKPINSLKMNSFRITGEWKWSSLNNVITCNQQTKIRIKSSNLHCHARWQ